MGYGGLGKGGGMALGAVLLFSMLPGTARGQQTLHSPLALQDRSGGGAFFVETGGGVLGSLAGVGAGLLIFNPDACDNEDIECILQRVTSVGVTSAVGATVGTLISGRLGRTSPSGWGAAIGAIAGVAAGAGAVQLLEEASGTTRGTAVIAYSVSQGLITAIGSRIGAGIR